MTLGSDEKFADADGWRTAAETVSEEELATVFDDHPFALCLTHDVDRPYKTYQWLWEAVRDRSVGALSGFLKDHNPYWQFETVRNIEADLGVRSAFYFLNEPHLLGEKPVRSWLHLDEWIEHLGRYDITDDALAHVIRTLDDDGWEVGLHGSFDSATNRPRLGTEKRLLESVLGHRIDGGRQHHLKLDGPTTWRHHRDIGLRYDTSLGRSQQYGFQYGYRPIRPFGDGFVVFPLTVMEASLPDPSARFDEALDVCHRLLEEAAQNRAVMTVLWHVRYFSEEDFPGYGRLYRRVVERALEMGAWVGSPVDLLDSMTADRMRPPPD